MTTFTSTPQQRAGVRRIYLGILTVFVLLFAWASCDSSTDPSFENGNSNGNADQPADEIWMSGTSFTPANREVETGSTLTWVNTSSMTHTVTSGPLGTHDGKFDSGNLAPGQTFEYTFDEAGEFPYYCIPHVNDQMAGTITVTDPDNGAESSGANSDGDSNGNGNGSY